MSICASCMNTLFNCRAPLKAMSNFAMNVLKWWKMSVKTGIAWLLAVVMSNIFLFSPCLIMCITHFTRLCVCVCSCVCRVSCIYVCELCVRMCVCVCVCVCVYSPKTTSYVYVCTCVCVVFVCVSLLSVWVLAVWTSIYKIDILKCFYKYF